MINPLNDGPSCLVYLIVELGFIIIILIFLYHQYSLTDQYFAGETFDMIERLPNGTYEIAIQRRYLAENFTQYPGKLSFHCHLLVLMTSWRMGINYKLFGDAGCIDQPPSINNG